MSRSGYTDGYSDDRWSFIMWRGAVRSAIQGQRGQRFLREMLAALDVMPIKRLVDYDLERTDKCHVSCSHWGLHEYEYEAVCAIGAVGRQRGVAMKSIDPEDYDTVAGQFGIASAMAREIVYANDDCGPYHEDPEQRFKRMRAWVMRHIRTVEPRG